MFVSYVFIGFKETEEGGRTGGKDSGKEGGKVYLEDPAIKCNNSEISLNLRCRYQNKSKQVLYEDFFPSCFSMTPWWHS